MTWESREDVAAACCVPVDWVPLNYADLSDDDLVYEIEERGNAERALRKSPFYALLSKA